jgi:hypothetical protein
MGFEAALSGKQFNAYIGNKVQFSPIYGIVAQVDVVTDILICMFSQNLLPFAVHLKNVSMFLCTNEWLQDRWIIH